MSVLFTADSHWSHANILRYCHRPFKTVGEMDAALVQNWNTVVRPEDTVYHLGDFTFIDHEKYLKRLNGTVHLVLGNHDKRTSALAAGFASVSDYKEVTADGQLIVLCHYAFRVWRKSHHGSWHLYGHSHGALPDDPRSLSFDVGVDCWDYTPVSIPQIRERMAKKDWKPINHHGSGREAEDTSS